MGIKKKKISELPLAETLVGLFTIGVDKLNRSVKVSLEFLKTSSDNADKAAKAANDAKTNADSAAKSATDAAKAANTSAGKADEATKNAVAATTAANDAAKNANTKATAADSAASSANLAAGSANREASNAGNKAFEAGNAAGEATRTTEEALATIKRLEELEESLVGQYKMIPTGMNLSYPRIITLRNPAALKVAYELLPTNTGRNVMFFSDDRAVSVLPDGGIVVKGLGASKVHVIPTENTEIYKTIEIKVVEPSPRKVSSVMRLTGNGSIRLT